MANVIASVAQYETEIRGERVRAGQAVARANGKRWGGSKPGIRRKITDSHVDMIRSSKDSGKSVTEIATTLGLSRTTVYGVLKI
jgi:DNA invertase Pin-like site-specific DNA recombinase